jgi:hypothetical protein
MEYRKLSRVFSRLESKEVSEDETAVLVVVLKIYSGLPVLDESLSPADVHGHDRAHWAYCT